jgi:hypothetical protein
MSRSTRDASGDQLEQRKLRDRDRRDRRLALPRSGIGT